ncbi:efflux RND transporter permease subunit [Halopiger djelfimassiliensis]|uniref:efflux RND transporter permease subunit n=1 Tax=Halopiger djelfimassiliensis TaxID=1293047 RepID=UPI000677A09C|nr:MMPL family transporter [Halopiger djelfimassiliensis]
MTDAGERIERATVRLNEAIVSRPKTVIVVFLVLTAVWAGGIPAVESEEDMTDAFTDDLPEQEALDTINAEFEGPFTTDEQTTQLVHTGNDVLSRQELLHVLSVLERVEQRDDLRMESAKGPATIVAQAIDPDAETIGEQRRAIEGATDSELRRAIRAAADEPGFSRIVSDDFNPNEASASASIIVIEHDVPQEFTDDDLTETQLAIQSIADDEPTDLRAFGQGLTDEELDNVIGDSIAIVMPIVVLLLLAFLVVAYQDPIDLVLGLIALVMTVIWTFGFLGYSGIPFGQLMIAVPVLLLAVGVDFGIHIVNRYREETVEGIKPVAAMRTANNQLMIAFVIVTVTTVFGFGANIVSDLPPIRNMGIASSVGIVFTFLIFGLFLPAAKLQVDRLRERYDVPEFNSTPIASEESSLGRVLSLPATASQHAPTVFVVVLLVAGVGMAGYGAGVDTTFETNDFLPPEENPGYVDYVPEPFAPGEYTITGTINLLEDRFETSQDESVMIYVEGPLEDDHALEALAEPNDNPTESLAVGENGGANARSINTVIQSYASEDPEFAALVARNDRNDNGIPDRNLDRIYDELFASPAGSQAEQYLTEDRRGAKIEYSVDSDATQSKVAADAGEFADEFRYRSTATGEVIIFDAVSTIIFESAIQGLILAIGLTAVFLVIVYAILEGKPLLGVVNVFPIAIAVAFLIGTMRALGMSLNALTATILSISIGLGIAYSVHTTARFIDEFDRTEDTLPALTTTLSGTGGALAGSMLTTSLGTGALAFAITPILGDFGLLMALSVFYSFVASIVALPPALFLWAQFAESGTGLERVKSKLRA